MTLNDLLPGQKAIIKKVAGSGSIHQRLREMGVMEGFPVEFIRTAPMGDPLEILIQGYYLSLRKSEALLIELYNESPA